jgi:hypothetical protein
MKWKKLGQIFQVNNNNPYLLTHASNPLPVHLHDSIFRVFYSGRDKNNKSSVGFVDIDIEKLQVINYPKEPVFTYGNEDSFYSHGVSIGNVYSDLDGNQFILFMGWQIRNNEHWRGDIGRLKLIHNQQLILDHETPFMTSDEEDPVSLSYPFVLHDEGIFKMWYGSTITWQTENNEMLHVVKYATSLDGIIWKKHNIAIPYQLGKAQAFSRPSVIKDSKGYYMWFSYRSGDGTKYRIGYSFSNDGIHWKETMPSGIDVSQNINDWDAEMVCYPFVFDFKGKRYMLYNGNNYGKTGFGLAILEKD